jgi:hypothetical protein
MKPFYSLLKKMRVSFGDEEGPAGQARERGWEADGAKWFEIKPALVVNCMCSFFRN